MADNKDAQPTVREILEEQLSAHAVDTPAESAAKVDSPQEPDAKKSERLRNGEGRFAKDSTPASDDATKLAPVKDATDAVVAPVVEPVTSIPRPSSWKKEMWPIWDKLNTADPLTPQEARQIAEYNMQREHQFAAGVSVYKQEAERSKPIMEAIAPFEQDLIQANIPAPQMVHNLLQAHRTLAMGNPAEKMQFFAKLAQDYGIPLNAYFDQAAQQQYLNSAPARAQLPRQPEYDLGGMVEKVIMEREAKQTIAGIERDVQKYPFFQYVRGTMAQLLEQGVTTDLDEAYQRALEMPEHSMLTTFMQTQQVKDAEQRKIEAQKTNAKVARANVVSTKSATPVNGATSNSKPSVRDALKSSMEEIMGSARV